jgi:hypothetical protein
MAHASEVRDVVDDNVKLPYDYTIRRGLEDDRVHSQTFFGELCKCDQRGWEDEVEVTESSPGVGQTSE